MVSTIPLPAEVLRVLDLKSREGWTGKITLNLKDGQVLSFGVEETHRVSTPGR